MINLNIHELGEFSQVSDFIFLYFPYSAFWQKSTQYYITAKCLFNGRNEKKRKRKKIAENTTFFCIFYLIFNGVTVN